MQDKPKQMQELLQFKECSSIKGSTYEGNFFLCSNTTEHNYSICQSCVETCHKSHEHITLAKGNYQCQCARDHHNTKLNQCAKKSNQCFYQDLFKHVINDGFYYVKETKTVKINGADSTQEMTHTYCCICSDYCMNKIPSGKVTKDEDKICECPHHDQCNAFLINKLFIAQSNNTIKVVNPNKKISFNFYMNQFNFNLLVKCPKTNEVTMLYVYNALRNPNQSNKEKLSDPILQKILQLFLISSSMWKKNMFYYLEPFETDVYEQCIELINEPPSLSYTFDELFQHLKTQFHLTLMLFSLYVKGKYSATHNHWTSQTIQNMNIYQRFKYILHIDTERSSAFCKYDQKDIDQRNEIINCLLNIYEQIFREYNTYPIYASAILRDCFQFLVNSMKFAIKYNLGSDSSSRKYFELLNETIPIIPRKYYPKKNDTGPKENTGALSVISNVIKNEALAINEIQPKAIKEIGSQDKDSIKSNARTNNKEKENEDLIKLQPWEFKISEITSNIIDAVLYNLLYYNDILTLKAMNIKFGHKQERSFAFTETANKNASQTMENLKSIIYTIIEATANLIVFRKIESIFEMMTQHQSFYSIGLANLKYLPNINNNLLSKASSVDCEVIKSISKRLRDITHQFYTFKIDFNEYGNKVDGILIELKDEISRYFQFNDLSIEYLNFYKRNDDENKKLSLQKLQRDVKDSELFQALSEIINISSTTEEFMFNNKQNELDKFDGFLPKKETRKFILQLYYLLISNDIESLTLVMNVSPKQFVGFFSQMSEYMLYFYERIVEILYFSAYILANTSFLENILLFYSGIMAKAKKHSNQSLLFYSIKLTQFNTLLFNKLGRPYQADLGANVQYIFSSLKTNCKPLFEKIFNAYFDGNQGVLDGEKVTQDIVRDCVQSYFKFVAQFDSLEISKYCFIHDLVTPLFFDFTKIPAIMQKYIISLDSNSKPIIDAKVVYPLLRFYIQRTAPFRPNIEMGNQMITNITNDLEVSPGLKKISNASLINIFKLPNTSNSQSDQIKAQMNKLFEAIDFVTFIAKNFKQIFIQHFKEKDTFTSILELKVISYLFLQNILIKPSYYLLKATEVYLVYMEGIMFDHIHQMLFYLLKAMMFFYMNIDIFENEGLNVAQNLNVYKEFNEYVDIEIQFALTHREIASLDKTIESLAQCKYFDVKDYMSQYEDIMTKVFVINTTSMPKLDQFNEKIDQLIEVYEEEIGKGSTFVKFNADRMNFSFFQSHFFELFPPGGRMATFTIKKILRTNYMVCLLESIIDSVTKQEDKNKLSKTLESIINQATISNLLLILSFSTVCEVIGMFDFRTRNEMRRQSMHVQFNTAVSKYFQIFCEGNNVMMKEFLFRAKYIEIVPTPIIKKDLPAAGVKKEGVASAAGAKVVPVAKKDGVSGPSTVPTKEIVKKEGVDTGANIKKIAQLKKEGNKDEGGQKKDVDEKKKEETTAIKDSNEGNKDKGDDDSKGKHGWKSIEITKEKMFDAQKGNDVTARLKKAQKLSDIIVEEIDNPSLTISSSTTTISQDKDKDKEKAKDKNKDKVLSSIPTISKDQVKEKPPVKEQTQSKDSQPSTSTTQSEPKGFLQKKLEAKKQGTQLEKTVSEVTTLLRKDKFIQQIESVDDKLKNKSISFFNIICSNMKLIQFKSEENQTYSLTTQMFLSIQHYLYSNTNLIYNCYKNLLIEMIQGYPFKSDYFSKIESDRQAPFGFYYLCENMNDIILNNKTRLDLTMINLKIDLFEVLVNIINQKYSYDQNANFLSVFNIAHLTNLLVYYIKYLYINHCRNVVHSNKSFDELMDNLVFSDRILTEMMNKYKRDPSIFKDKIFQLSRHLYLFIKLIGDKCRNRTALSFLENGYYAFLHAKKVGDLVKQRNLIATGSVPPVVSTVPSRPNTTLNQDQQTLLQSPSQQQQQQDKDKTQLKVKSSKDSVIYLEKIISAKIFTCRFFNKIMKKIEIVNVTEKAKETRNVIFLHDPKIYIIDNREMSKVLLNTDRTSRATKLKSIVEVLPDLTEKIKYKTAHRYNPQWTWLTDFNYAKVDMFNCFLTVIINILFLQFLDNSAVSSVFLSRSAKYLEWTLVIVNLFFLTVFLITKYPLYVHLNKIKHFQQKSPSYYNLINVYFVDSYLFNEEINTMIIVIVIAIYSLFSNYEVILFSLLLLTISKFSDTIQEIIQAFGKRFSQLMAMIFFLAILTFFFANFDFYFLRDSFIIEQETGEVLNTCSSLLECFLTIFNNGVQSGGGIGDVLGDSEYSTAGYYKRWIHDMIFYLIVMMFLLNMINGIIITTFSQLREESNAKEEDMKNICFICSIPTYELEKKNITLKQHFKKEHNLKTYVRYLAMLSLMNDNDMDQDQFYVYNCLQKKSLEFFPLFE